MTGIFTRKGESSEKPRGRWKEKEGSVKAEAGIGIILAQTKKHQKLEEARKDSCLEPSVRSWPF